MSKLRQKLDENKNRIKREKLLSALEPQFSAFLANAEFSGDAGCIRSVAFPAADEEGDVRKTERGESADRKIFRFRTWHDLISVLKRFQQVKNYIGWFFADADGPYYKISLNALLANIESVAKYGAANRHYDFGWVGAVDDVGILIRCNYLSSGANKFEISVWGL